VLLRLAPGDPIDAYINPNVAMSQEEMDAVRSRLGLDQPLPLQYLAWLGSALRGDLGFSLQRNGETVLGLVAERIGPTLLLMGTSLVVAYLIAIPIGILAARKKNSPTDYSVVGAAFLGISVPHFFLGLVLIYVFALELGWLPTGNMMTLGRGGGFVDRVNHLILPVAVLATATAANMTRYVRSSMIDAFGQDYIRTAKAKGLGSLTITNKHALRNALIPVVTVVGVDLSALIGGAIVTEQIFQWPGIGLLTIQSIGARDYAVLMGINLIAAVAVFGANLLTDIAYAVVDPRVAYA